MRGQRVLAPDGGPEWWTVLDETLAVVDPVDEFLAHLTAIERSPGTVRSYAFDLRDYFDFLGAHRIDWRTVRLEHLGRFVGWLRLAPTVRSAEVTSLAIDEPHCSAATINRKLLVTWNLAAAEFTEIRESPAGGMGHACEMETSIMLATHPEHVDTAQAVRGGPSKERGFRTMKTCRDALVLPRLG